MEIYHINQLPRNIAHLPLTQEITMFQSDIYYFDFVMFLLYNNLIKNGDAFRAEINLVTVGCLTVLLNVLTAHIFDKGTHL